MGEIGERQVLLRLYLLVRETPWQVYHNLCEPGYDVLLSNPESGESVRIEVKTRQRIHTPSRHKGTVHYTLTESEYKACDYVVAYLLDDASSYVVPISEVRETSADGRPRWRLTVSLDREGKANPQARQYLGAWSRIHPVLRDDQVAG